MSTSIFFQQAWDILVQPTGGGWALVSSSHIRSLSLQGKLHLPGLNAHVHAQEQGHKEGFACAPAQHRAGMWLQLPSSSVIQQQFVKKEKMFSTPRFQVFWKHCASKAGKGLPPFPYMIAPSNRSRNASSVWKSTPLPELERDALES